MHIWSYPYAQRKGLTDLARLFGDLSHPLRLRVVGRLLANGEECVCRLAHGCGVDQPTLSRHLRILKDHGVLKDRREGPNIYYRVTDARAVRLIRALDDLPLPEGRSVPNEEEP